MFFYLIMICFEFTSVVKLSVYPVYPVYPVPIDVSTQLCQYPIMSVSNYVSICVSVCKCVSMQVCQYASVSVCKCVSMLMCQYANVSVC